MWMSLRPRGPFSTLPGCLYVDFPSEPRECLSLCLVISGKGAFGAAPSRHCLNDAPSLDSGVTGSCSVGGLYACSCRSTCNIFGRLKSMYELALERAAIKCQTLCKRLSYDDISV